MKIQILDEALEDLAAGYYCYEKQGDGLGRYFRDALLADLIP